MRIGFIGLGGMGLGMAQNLVANGFDTIVFDIRPEPATTMAAEGATAATSVADLGGQCSIVFVCVYSAAQVEAVVLGRPGSPGLLGTMAQGGIVVLNSTVEPGVASRIAGIASESGIDVLDAPITGGGSEAAKNGKLTFLVGGDPAVVARVRPALDAMAASVVHMGPLGTGGGMKIISNFVANMQALSVREALRMGAALGIGENQTLGALNAGLVGSSWTTMNWNRVKALEDNCATGRSGLASTIVKDMIAAHGLAREKNLRTPMLDALVKDALPDIQQNGFTDRGIG